jgi:hypothetical protein
MDILKTIGAEYLIEIFGDKNINLITNDLISNAQDKANNDFSEYIKSNPSEDSIKHAGLHYFLAIYLLIKLENNDSKINKEYLKNLVSEKNNILDFRNTLSNFDFYLGSCGIEAQNLALNNNENI